MLATRITPLIRASGVRTYAIRAATSSSIKGRLSLGQTPLLNSMSHSGTFTMAKRFGSDLPGPKDFWNAPQVDYDKVKARSQQPTTTSWLIDVREPDEVAQGSIPSSVSIPLSGFSAALLLPAIEFKSKYGFEKPGKDQEVIVYCRSGKRSATAADEAFRRGYTKVLNYSGSWLDWTSKEQARKSAKWEDDE